MLPGMPGVNPRQMKQMMKKMGVTQDELEATQVIIKTASSVMIFDNPQVTKVNMMGQESYQITGSHHEESLDTKPTITEDDVKTVMEQAHVSKEAAINAIADANGDLAEAIMKLKE